MYQIQEAFQGPIVEAIGSITHIGTKEMQGLTNAWSRVIPQGQGSSYLRFDHLVV